MNLWLTSIIGYLALAAATAIPILIVLLRGVSLHPGGDGFSEATHFSDEGKTKLIQHWSRMQGTLGFWKKHAELYRRAHYYVIFWTVPSAVLVPLLVQAIDDDPYSRWLVTVVSTFTASLFALHRALKIEEHYKAYRLGESNFFDMYRRMLDRPETFGESESEQIARYIETAEKHRRLIRNTEIDITPSIETIRNDVAGDDED